MKELKFIVREPGSGTRQEFESSLKEIGFQPEALDIVAEMNSTEAILSAVREGLGVSVVSCLCAEEFLKLGLIEAYSIEGLDLTRSFYLVANKYHSLSPVASAFKEFVLSLAFQ